MTWNEKEREREKDKESVSTGTKRRKLQKGSWVRTRESRGGLSEGGKGGLLHSQLVELGQLLRVWRDSRAKRLLLYDRSHQEIKKLN